ncbi:hypothetical protein NP493_366g02091 [Ridgeia piscesae]|uniref:LHFPL tetraspan subfamily member 3 protein n=1 Tax=Ridgeia piscesae TaxID=27915 RepID=A0AAD9NVA8_RIDPI|nr:hypothetical protein NP493_366g02091 [Ridgeia piscesae]
MEVHQLTETSRVYYTNYVRNSRAVGVMWAIFTICFAIFNIVVFLQPQWIGDTDDSPAAGYFGLYEYCTLTESGQNLDCHGRFDQYSSVLSLPFYVAAIFIGVSALAVLICICCMLLFFFMKSAVVYLICGWIQVISGLCMFLGCIIYPVGWNNVSVQGVCGASAAVFQIGQCGIRWAYILAIIGIFDIFVLAVLAFVLASRQAKWPQAAPIYKSEIGGFQDTASKHSIAIQPVVSVPQPEYSQYSQASGRHSRGNDFVL